MPRPSGGESERRALGRRCARTRIGECADARDLAIVWRFARSPDRKSWIVAALRRYPRPVPVSKFVLAVGRLCRRRYGEGAVPRFQKRACRAGDRRASGDLVIAISRGDSRRAGLVGALADRFPFGVDLVESFGGDGSDLSLVAVAWITLAVAAICAA